MTRNAAAGPDGIDPKRGRLHQLGTATAVANFFRQLGGALIVAIFGAIVLSGVGPVEMGVSFETIASAIRVESAAGVFRWVFDAALMGFAFGFLLAMEERPLRGSAAKAADAIVAD